MVFTPNHLRFEMQLDKIGWDILETLQQDARLSFAEIGRRVGLSAPAVAERVQKMEDEGLILGYRAVGDTAKLGRSVQAIMHLQVDRANFQRSMAQIQEFPEVLVCYRTTGSSCLIMQVAVASMEQLQALIDRLMPFGEPVTQMILSTVLPRRPIGAL